MFLERQRPSEHSRAQAGAFFGAWMMKSCRIVNPSDQKGLSFLWMSQVPVGGAGGLSRCCCAVASACWQKRFQQPSSQSILGIHCSTATCRIRVSIRVLVERGIKIRHIMCRFLWSGELAPHPEKGIPIRWGTFSVASRGPGNSRPPTKRKFALSIDQHSPRDGTKHHISQLSPT